MKRNRRMRRVVVSADGHGVVSHAGVGLQRETNFPELTCCEDVWEALHEADVVLHLTEWADYAALDPAKVARVVRCCNIVDGRNVLDPSR